MPFSTALSLTLAHEGGYVHDPDDRGGETNYGITIATARANGYTGPMKDIPMDVVRRIYQAGYWDALKLDHVDALSTELSAKLFDIAVNMGPKRAGQFLQQGINLLNRGEATDIAVDGIVGNGTLSALRKMRITDMPALLVVVRSLQADHYLSICQRDPVQRKFLRGWLKRL